jgi:hypothetical protein
MHATLIYNVLRLTMILVVGAVCYVAGARGITLVLLAFIISLPLSFVLLARFRRAMIDEIAAKAAGRKSPARAISDRIDAGASAEDAILDAQEAREREAAADSAEATADGRTERRDEGGASAT